MKRPATVIALVVALQTVAWAPPAREAGVRGGLAPAADEAFRRLSRDYLEWYFAHHPVRASRLGVHEYDAELPDLSRSGIEIRVADSRDWLSRLEAIDRVRLDRDASFDHRILDHAIRAELLDLEEIGSWHRNPMLYTAAIADGVASLVERDFAPLEQRLGNLIVRLESLPEVIVAARDNLDDVPPLWAEIAARSAEATVDYLLVEVPAALREQGLESVDPELHRRWSREQLRAVRRLEQFAAWLDRELAPKAHGDFRLGREAFERKLLYEEHFSFSSTELRAMNQGAIRAYREWVGREAARIDPARPAERVMAEITRDFPAPEELIPTARRLVEQAREFVVERRIVTLPVDELPVVRPTPPFARSGFASMSTPGPFDPRGGVAFCNITNVDPQWSPARQSQYLSYFNYPALLGIAVHEVMPGHFVQLLWRERLASDVRKVFLPASVVEGWAHYAEQMMVDEGLGDGNPVVRLAQLRRALQRHARWEAGLDMHVFGTSIQEAARRFQHTAYFAEFPALREVQRGTYDPTYLYYALGRMEILRLREDYRRYKQERGETFSLREFHDRFLGLGLPIPLAREALIPAPPRAEERIASRIIRRPRPAREAEAR